MTKRAAALIATLALAGAMTARAKAHRLDEYLQQTLLELQPQRVVLHVSLTPGVDVASALLAKLDADHDGLLSNDERSTYAATVQRGLSLSLDDVALPLRLIDASCPPVEAMTRGLGTIVLTLEASPPGGLHTGRLRLINQPTATNSVYLVNALVPHASTLHVGPQLRNADQSSYEVALTVDTASTATGFQYPLSIVAMMLAGVLALVSDSHKRPRKGLRSARSQESG